MDRVTDLHIKFLHITHKNYIGDPVTFKISKGPEDRRKSIIRAIGMIKDLSVFIFEAKKLVGESRDKEPTGFLRGPVAVCSVQRLLAAGAPSKQACLLCNSTFSNGPSTKLLNTTITSNPDSFRLRNFKRTNIIFTLLTRF